MVASAGETDRDWAGRQFTRNCLLQYYIVLNIIILKLHNFIMFILFNSLKLQFYNIINFQKDITEKVRLVILHGLATIDVTH